LPLQVQNQPLSEFGSEKMALNKPKQANETAKNEESSEDDLNSDDDLPPLAEAGTSPGMYDKA
jgi:hypothetical protein